MDTDILLVSRETANGAVQNGEFSQAALLEEKALKITQDQYGLIHPSLVPILNDLGTLQRIQAKYKEAEQNFKWALAIQEKEWGPDHPEVAQSLRHLAALDVDLGRYPEAQMLYQRGLKIQEKSLGKDSLA